jgi:superkiller protein 3
LTEEVEKNKIDREVEKRRTRLDSASKSRETLRNEIGAEIWKQSKLPELYELVLSHVDASDEVRREAEHKLLSYRYKYLQALPNPAAKVAGSGSTAAKEQVEDKEADQKEDKSDALQAVQSLASGIVAINVPDELAWTITMEWSNVFSPVELKRHEMRAFVDHFPRSGLSRSLQALLYTIEDEQFIKEEKERFEAQDLDIARPDPLSLAIEGIEEATQSVLAHRIAAILYLLDRDWLSCSELATIGLDLAKKLEISFAVDLRLVKAGLECSLATALTHLHPPQHHARALRLSDAVLSRQPSAIDATLSKAYIAQTAGRWDQARSLFASVVSQQTEDALSPKEQALLKLSISRNPTREAKLEVAWCDVKLGKLGQGRDQLQEVISDLDDSPSSNNEDQAKAWWRLGICLWEMGGEHREETSQAFTCFITALKRDSSFAPAFTSLGQYYSSVSQPPDAARAAKCFQKAFELDPTENIAARRLAESYADDGDWDLVYLVAQRTIEGEGGGLALGGEITSQRRHITQNAWAWTAIGSTQLIRENFEKAIVAFQIALRNFPSDGNIWMRLGEAYTASGRFTAGIKTFEKALEIFKGSDEEWQPLFSIANVERQQTKYQEALEVLIQLCTQEPGRLAIKTACAETRFSLALDEIKQGYTERGTSSLLLAAKEAIQVLTIDEHVLAAWKVLADAFFQIAALRLSVEDEDIRDMTGEILNLSAKYNVDAGLPSISAVTLDMLDSASTSQALFMSIYLGKLRVLLHHDDEQVAGSAWMDLSMGLHQLMIEMEHRGDKDESKENQAQAIACAKEALKMEPGNGSYWTAMGDLVVDSGVKLAQHCYIKAVESDSQAVTPWVNLGFLYLRNDDVNLAKECFVRAQTIDPDHVQSWIGHAMVAKKHGNNQVCRSMYQHAYAVEQGLELEAAYGFSSTLFKAISDGEKVVDSQIYSASFALSSYLSQRPDDVSALNLSALFAERWDELETAIERIDRASSILEGSYERDESAEKAQLFAVCMVNLGRIRFESADYDGAKESFEMALGLLIADEEAEEGSEVKGDLRLSKNDLKRAQMGARCGSGIAQFASGQEAEAIEALRQAIEEMSEVEEESIDGKEQLHLLLAKMLWNAGEKQEGEAAVMEALSLSPKSVDALLTLGSMSVCNQDQEQLDLVLNEMQEILTPQTVSDDERIISFVVAVQLGNGQIESAIKILQKETSPASRIELIRLLLQLTLRSHLSDTREDTLQQVLHQANSLLFDISKNFLKLGQDYLVVAVRLLTIAMALKGDDATATKEMAMRAIALEPENISHWTLLKIIQ